MVVVMRTVNEGADLREGMMQARITDAASRAVLTAAEDGNVPELQVTRLLLSTLLAAHRLPRPRYLTSPKHATRPQSTSESMECRQALPEDCRKQQNSAEICRKHHFTDCVIESTGGRC